MKSLIEPKESEGLAEVYADFVKSFEEDKSDRRTAAGLRSKFRRGGSLNLDSHPSEFSVRATDDDTRAQQRDSRFSTSVVLPTVSELDLKRIRRDTRKSSRRRKKKESLASLMEMLKESESTVHCTATRTRRTDAAQKPNSKSTNLYVSNLPLEMTESKMTRVFGRFGEVASVKIMWPRSQVERSRQRLCGFVSFLHRVDAENAMNRLSGGEQVFGERLRVGWGKHIPLPNATESSKAMPEEIAAVIPVTGDLKLEVTVPSDARLKAVIDKTAMLCSEFGSQFEHLLHKWMRSDSSAASLFSFLDSDLRNESHVYYRWRTLSLCNGDTMHSWRIAPFQVVSGGAIWQPPAMDKVVTQRIMEVGTLRVKGLGKADRQWLEAKVTALDLDCSRQTIRQLMVFCLDNSRKAAECVSIVCDAFSDCQVATGKALLLLVSDILLNAASVSMSGTGAKGASAFQSEFRKRLRDAFDILRLAALRCQSRMQRADLSRTVDTVLSVWRKHFVFPALFADELKRIFERGQKRESREKSESEPKRETNDSAEVETKRKKEEVLELGFFGHPKSYFDSTTAPPLQITVSSVCDIDGVPF